MLTPFLSIVANLGKQGIQLCFGRKCNTDYFSFETCLLWSGFEIKYLKNLTMLLDSLLNQLNLFRSDISELKRFEHDSP